MLWHVFPQKSKITINHFLSFKFLLKREEGLITACSSSVCFCFRRFLVSGLSDSQWHWVSVGVSLEYLAVYVNCVLVEKVRWTFPYLGIPTDGLLMLGGILQGFETPFEVFCFVFFKHWEKRDFERLFTA